MDQAGIKVAIKQWEHEFRKNNGRNPTKDDIRANHDISHKYKLYKKLKAKPKPVPETPTRKRLGNPQLNTPLKTSPLKVEEVGPTPQLNGRVLSIFDVITSPKVTPLKSSQEGQFESTETPTRKLDFSDILSDDEYSDVSEYSGSGSENEIQVPSSQMEFKTPTKNKVINLMETPAYLKTSSQPQFVTASPSPLATQRMRKPLSTIIDELKDIQDDLKYGDYDIDELIPKIEEEKEDDAIDNFSDEGEEDRPKRYKKKPTQKRSTRRVKMKARYTQDESGPVIDLRSKMASLADVPEITSEGNSEDEQWSDSEKPYVRQKLDPNAKAPVRRNFKKLKIQKRKFFGKRARR